MRHDIRDVRVIIKGGAFGNPNAYGHFVYGRRLDGRTVPCKHEMLDDGTVQIWFCRSTDGPELEEDMTKFSSAERKKITRAPEHEQKLVSNEILRNRELTQV